MNKQLQNEEHQTLPWQERKPVKVNVFGLPRNLWLSGLILLSIAERDALIAEVEWYRETLEQALWVCRELSEEVNALDGLSNLTNGMSGVSVAYLNAIGLLAGTDECARAAFERGKR